MFDLSFGELVVIAVVALLVLGPERLPKAARFAGLWVRKARAQWYTVKSEFERELAAEEFKRSLGSPVKDLRDEVEGLGRDLDSTVRDAESEARAERDAATALRPSAADAAPDATPGTHPEAARGDGLPPTDRRPEPPAP